jgi:hypothetical protein
MSFAEGRTRNGVIRARRMAPPFALSLSHDRGLNDLRSRITVRAEPVEGRVYWRGRESVSPPRWVNATDSVEARGSATARSSFDKLRTNGV